MGNKQASASGDRRERQLKKLLETLAKPTSHFELLELRCLLDRFLEMRQMEEDAGTALPDLRPDDGLDDEQEFDGGNGESKADDKAERGRGDKENDAEGEDEEDEPARLPPIRPTSVLSMPELAAHPFCR